MSKDIKVAVISFCGNVGKSSIAKNLLQARLKLEKESVIEIETINGGLSDDGLETTKFSARKFDDMINEIMVAESAIVDVGASNVEEFFLKMERQSGSHEEFHRFIVPVTPAKHSQTEGKKTIRALNALGVPKERISVVFNMVEPKDFRDIESIMADVMPLGKKHATINTGATIFQDGFFDDLKRWKTTIPMLQQDTFDYRADLKRVRLEDPEKEPYYFAMIALKRKMPEIIKNLDNVFAELDL